MTFPEGTAYRLARDIESLYTQWQQAAHGNKVRSGEHRGTNAEEIERTAAKANDGGSFDTERSPAGEETTNTRFVIVLLRWWPVVHLRGIRTANGDIEDPQLVYLEWGWRRVRNADTAALAWFAQATFAHTPERMHDLTRATWVSARSLFDGAVITVFDGRRSPTGTIGADHLTHSVRGRGAHGRAIRARDGSNAFPFPPTPKG